VLIFELGFANVLKNMISLIQTNPVSPCGWEEVRIGGSRVMFSGLKEAE
jgi:hypothetical protein